MQLMMMEDWLQKSWFNLSNTITSRSIS